MSPSRLKAGGVTAIVQTLRADVHPSADHAAGLTDLQGDYETISRLLGSGLSLAREPEDVPRIVEGGDIALILELQNTAPFETIDDLTPWLERGVSVVGPAFIGNNRWAESSRPYPFASHPRSVVGLTADGRELVRFLNRAGVIIDVSQLSDRAVQDVLETSSAPVLASHTGLRRQIDAARNLPDDLARRIGSGGGVLQLVAFGMYLRHVDPSVLPELAELWRAQGLTVPAEPTGFYSVDDPATATWDADRFYEFLHEYHVILKLDEPNATVSDLVDAIDSAVELVGIDSVGLASDFNHGGGIVGWSDASQTPHVIDALHTRGYTATEVEKIFGGNFLRLWRDVRLHREEHRV